jgi:hypothetical protein
LVVVVVEQTIQQGHRVDQAAEVVTHLAQGVLGHLVKVLLAVLVWALHPHTLVAVVVVRVQLVELRLVVEALVVLAVLELHHQLAAHLSLMLAEGVEQA